MIKYIIDTNIISELSRHSPDKKVLEWASTINRCGAALLDPFV